MFTVNLIRFADRNAFFCCLIVFLIIFTWDTFWYVEVKMSIFWACLTFISNLIPIWSCWWTRLAGACCSINNRLICRTRFTYFINRIPSWLIFWAHTDTSACLIAWFDRCETDTLIGLLIKFISCLACTNPFSKREDWPLWTSKTCVVDLISIRGINGTCGHVEFCCLCEHNKSVLLFSNVPINPVWCFKIILVKSVIQINQSSCRFCCYHSWYTLTIPIDVIVHNRKVNLSSGYLMNQFIRYCTLISGLLCTFLYLCFHVK